MARLRELTKVLRSKNAGPFMITFDLLFRNAEDMARVVDGKVLAVDRVAKILQVPEKDIEVYEYTPANAIKITVPRTNPSGAFDDSDVFGCQQHAWMLDLEVPNR